MSFYRQRTPQFDMRVVGLVLLVLTLLFVVRTREARGQVREVGVGSWLINPESLMVSTSKRQTINEADSLVLAKTILQSEEVQKQVQFMAYFGQDKREYAGCMEGRFIDNEADTVVVTRLLLAVVDSSATRSVSPDYRSCETDRTIGLLHSHPTSAYCGVSDGDVWIFFTWPVYRKYNLVFLVCPGSRLIAYSRSDMRRIATENFITRTGKEPKTFSEVLEDTLRYALENQSTIEIEFRPRVTPMKALFDSVFTP